ncbi:DNA polymerase [Cyclospora cayetanensis]|uniref:DNA polymerase n=1 Tax=Cyclospora cayetanensis TaxID=88456 RepID=A0A1D3CZH1_9EIME|nr:DNA polymerase [Cyclospora cayetanensis]
MSEEGTSRPLEAFRTDLPCHGVALQEKLRRPRRSERGKLRAFFPKYATHNSFCVHNAAIRDHKEALDGLKAFLLSLAADEELENGLESCAAGDEWAPTASAPASAVDRNCCETASIEPPAQTAAAAAARSLLLPQSGASSVLPAAPSPAQVPHTLLLRKQNQQQAQGEGVDPGSLSLEKQLERLRRLAKAKGLMAPLPQHGVPSSGHQADIHWPDCLPAEGNGGFPGAAVHAEAPRGPPGGPPEGPPEAAAHVVCRCASEDEHPEGGPSNAAATLQLLPSPGAGNPQCFVAAAAPSLHGLSVSSITAPSTPGGDSAGDFREAPCSPSASDNSPQEAFNKDRRGGLSASWGGAPSGAPRETPPPLGELPAPQRPPPSVLRRSTARGSSHGDEKTRNSCAAALPSKPDNGSRTRKKKATPAKAKANTPKRGPSRGQVMFNPLLAWEAVCGGWQARRDVTFITSLSAFETFVGENFPVEGASVESSTSSATPSQHSASGGPPCWVFSVLFEDGSSSSMCSKKLDAARFKQKTLRARFPRPVAIVLSRGSMVACLEGPYLASRSSEASTEEALQRLTQGTPKDWQHFVMPVAEFALNEALRPLLAEELAIPLGKVCFLDVSLMVWLAAPDDSQSAGALSAAAARLKLPYSLLGATPSCFSEEFRDQRPPRGDEGMCMRMQGNLSSTDLGVSEEASVLWTSSMEGAAATAAIASILGQSILSQGLCRILEAQEGPIALLLAVIETTGIACDLSLIEPLKSQLQEVMARLTAACSEAAGFSFTPSSVKQVAYVLYTHLKLGVPPAESPGSFQGGPQGTKVVGGGERTKQFCTDDNVLQGLRDAHPVVPLLQSYRQIAKLYSTYLAPLTPVSCTYARRLKMRLYAARAWREDSHPELAEGCPDAVATPKTEGPVGFHVPQEGPLSLHKKKAKGFSTPWAAGRNPKQPAELPRVFCRWNQTHTVTGRLSASYYNMQTIPREAVLMLPQRGPTGAPSAAGSLLGAPSVEVKLKCREAFVPTDPARQELVSADFSQIEMRVLVNFESLDRRGGQRLGEGRGAGTLLCRSGADPYKEMAAAVAGVSLDAVSDELRAHAKVACLSLLYGGGLQTVAQQLGMGLEAAVKCRQQFLEAFPEVAQFAKDSTAFAQQHGYVTTLAGRRRPLKLENMDSAALSRQAVNSRIQGSASDIIKQAMLAVQRALQTRKFKGSLPPRLLLSLHDELLVECCREDTEALISLMKEEMQGAATLAVPLVVVIRKGASWGDLVETRH